MVSDCGWLSLLPPLMAIALALTSRQVHLSLLAGLWLGTTLLAGWNPMIGATDALGQLVDVLTDPGNAGLMLFILLAGGLIALVRDSGGVDGFADWMVRRRWVRSARSAQVISILLGVCIFIESSITCLVTGAVSRPLYDRFGVSRAKLAYACDATSAPICMLLPLNAWGAVILGLLAQEGVKKPVAVLLAAIPLNFYAVAALALVVIVATTGWNIGPMRRAERRQAPLASAAQGLQSTAHGSPARPRAYNLLLPIVVTIAVVPLGLVITGKGHLTEGSGSTSVLWGVCAGIAVAMIIYRAQGIVSFTQATEIVIKGVQELVAVGGIMLLALALSSICRKLGTGPWVAQTVSPWLGPATVAPLVFLAGAVVSFSTGTSFGTFAILMPIAVPLAQDAGASLALTTAAVMGGGVFGDHCSPISDTTVLSSLSAGCDHVEHVLTQLPYALIGGVIATVCYALVGLLG